ncbi:MAG: hypothetical protein V1789_03970, partial [PVC group bacterium]
GGVEALQPAVKTAGGTEPKTLREHRDEPVGALTPLLEKYRGRTLPQARPGFGLPEIYQAFSESLGRPVPFTEQEAELILTWLKRSGPFDPAAFQGALDSVLKRLGRGRPLARIVAALEKIIAWSSTKKEAL